MEGFTFAFISFTKYATGKRIIIELNKVESFEEFDGYIHVIMDSGKLHIIKETIEEVDKLLKELTK